MPFLEYAIGANYGRFWRRLKEAGARDGRSPVALAAIFAGCMAKYGCGLTDYVDYQFWNLTKEERREYVTIKDSDIFYEKVNPAKHKTFFTVKPNFLKNFAPYIKRDYFLPETGSAEELARFLQGKAQVMVKPVDGLGGHGVRKLTVAELGDPAAFLAELRENRLFLEDLIVQHPDISAICPTSVNTIRVMTVAAGGRSQILYAGLRVGAGADVDNFHAGGMGVHIDVDTGVLTGDAVNKQGTEFPDHPVTGTHFDGRRLPMWEEVRRICLEAALVNTRIHVVGWDVAVTPDGPVFVEGNRRPGFDLPQMTSHRGRKDIMRTAEAFIAREEGRQG